MNQDKTTKKEEKISILLTTVKDKHKFNTFTCSGGKTPKTQYALRDFLTDIHSANPELAKKIMDTLPVKKEDLSTKPMVYRWTSAKDHKELVSFISESDKDKREGSYVTSQGHGEPSINYLNTYRDARFVLPCVEKFSNECGSDYKSHITISGHAVGIISRVSHAFGGIKTIFLGDESSVASKCLSVTLYPSCFIRSPDANIRDKVLVKSEYIWVGLVDDKNLIEPAELASELTEIDKLMKGELSRCIPDLFGSQNGIDNYNPYTEVERLLCDKETIESLAGHVDNPFFVG